MRACIVVPTIREDCIKAFLAAWGSEFRDHRVIVVEDNPTRTFTLPDWVTHVAWEDIDEDLKRDSWIIPRRSGAIRNYGNLLASRHPGLDMIVNLDDDCMRESRDFLEQHWLALEETGADVPLFDTMHSLDLVRPRGPDEVRPRGFPKRIREIRTMLNHGLWNHIPDIDGETQLREPLLRVLFPLQSHQVPPGTLFPMSAMNIAFRPELLPAMYNLPMGQGQPFHRFDDIWCGLIMKKACDAMGWAVRSGSPCIRHIRASDAKKNAELEAPGILENEKVWRTIALGDYGVTATDGSAGTLDEWLVTIHEALRYLGPYWDKAHDASRIWRRLVAGDK